MLRICVYALLIPAAYAADVCNPANFPGAYGFMLSGTTSISGESKPVVSVARLVFDGSGKVSGTSSVNFGGLLLGNRVTGEYTLKNDCSLTWKLQDDSGNFQGFAGRLSLDGKHIEFAQTDPGSPQRGAMVRSAESCPSSDFRGRYRIAIAGTTTNMDTGTLSGTRNINGAIEADGNTGLRFTPDRDSAPADAATYQMEGDCVLRLQLTLAGQPMNFRAILVNEGKELLGIETDAGSTVTLRITPQ
jgi:hypothetical protein